MEFVGPRYLPKIWGQKAEINHQGDSNQPQTKARRLDSPHYDTEFHQLIWKNILIL